MNKIILLTIIFAISYDVAWAQTTEVSAVEIREHTGALVSCSDALLGSITTQGTSGTLAASPGVTGKTHDSTTGSGSGAKFTFIGDGSAHTVTGLQVTAVGSGYKVGDTLTFNSATVTGTTGAIVITLQTDDIANGALACGTGDLASSVTTQASGGTSLASGSGVTGKTHDSTTGSGTGATFTFIGDGSATTVVEALVTAGGSGYKAGDTLTFNSATVTGTTGAIVITLQADDVTAKGSLQLQDGLAQSVLTPASSGTLSATPKTITQKSTTGAGKGAVFSIVGTGSSKEVVAIFVTNPGSGYQEKDNIVFDGTELGVTGDVTVKLGSTDIHAGYLRVHKDGRLRDSVGDLKSWDDVTKTGYYVPLSISTESISVVASFDGTGHTLVPQISTFSDTSLVTAVNSKLLPVNDGLNVLKLVSSLLGTYEINLIKPADQIKVIQSNKRSFEIAYTPAAVGEFTCSAFTGDVTDPTDRAEVKTLSGVVAKSVTTNNIVKNNIFRSVQMTLNGLTPFQAYEIHCYHAAHDVISYTDTTTGNALAKTDKASLSGVTIAMSDKAGAWVSGTLTVTFTHEKTLLSTNKIYLALYDNLESVQAFTRGDDCADAITITSAGETISGSHTCAKISRNGIAEVLEITLGANSNVAATSSGTEIVIQLTNTDNHLSFPDNAAAGTKVTLDLEADDHTLLEQIEGWTTA